jgi:hypothetical protein
MDISMLTSPGPAAFTLGEQLLLLSFWVLSGYLWLQNRRRLKLGPLWARIFAPWLVTVGIAGTLIEVVSHVIH